MKRYEPQGFALEIFKSRYAMDQDETWEEACNRLAQQISYAEKDELTKKKWKTKFFEELITNRFMPGGRIWHSAGRPKGNLLNCYVIPVGEDSREGWTKAISDATIITSMGGGVGLNFAPIRPKGMDIRGTGGVAAGACGLMHIINAVGDVVRASGGRKPALMMCLDLDHPDLPEFLDKKLDLNQLNNANISVFVPHEKEEMFIDAVKNNKDWPLMWGNKVHNTINARDLWNRLISNNLKSAEPGILNGHLMNRMNNIHYYKPLIATNPCLTGDMKLLTATGYRTMRELWIAGGSKKFNGIKNLDQYGYMNIINGNDDVARATNVYKTSDDSEIFRVTLNNGTFIDATANHKFIVIDTNEIETKYELNRLRVGDKLPMARLGLYNTPLRSTATITAIEQIENQETFCLTEPLTHKIIVNGIIIGNCGEIPLEEYGACDLGAIVLSRFVDDSGKFDWVQLGETIATGVRFLDNVLDVTTYPVHESQVEMMAVRRLGLGVVGLHHMLLLMGMKYNSEEAFQFVDDLFKFIRNRAYEASCFLATEKGVFPKFDTEKFMESGFVKTLSHGIREKIRLYGVRNCALLCIAPTGTTSIVCDVSSGIEPVYAMAYERRYRSGEETKMEMVYDSAFKRFASEGRDTSILQSTYDIDVRGHLTMQMICQKYVDNAVSKTVNVPRIHDKQNISDLMLEFLPKLKGVTVYVDGSRGESPLSGSVSIEDALTSYNHLSGCKNGMCDI